MAYICVIMIISSEVLHRWRVEFQICASHVIMAVAICGVRSNRRTKLPSLCRMLEGSVRTELSPSAFKEPEAQIWVDFAGEPLRVCEPILRQAFDFHPLMQTTESSFETC